MDGLEFFNFSFRLPHSKSTPKNVSGLIDSAGKAEATDQLIATGLAAERT